jgi:flagellin
MGVDKQHKDSHMTLTLLTNIASLAAQRNVNNTQNSLEASVERLSSGIRINHASDDAAGLAISSKLSAVIRGLTQAERNANDGVSMIQTAEAGLGEVNGLMARMRELAVEAANGGTLGNSERSALDVEFQALTSEISRIVSVTSYNGQQLIDGSLSAGTTFQVGAFNTASDRISFSVGSSDTTTLSINTLNVTDVTNAQNSIDALDKAIGTIASTRAGIGAAQNRLATTIDNLSQSHTNLSAANSRILDTDVAEETANLTRNTILLQAGVSVLAQANQQPQAALQLLGR